MRVKLNFTKTSAGVWTAAVVLRPTGILTWFLAAH